MIGMHIKKTIFIILKKNYITNRALLNIIN
jgi:hypothetical protein